jgi:hypothetical protein
MKCTIKVHKLKIEFGFYLLPSFYLKKKKNKKPTYQPIVKKCGLATANKEFFKLGLRYSIKPAI